MAYLLPCKIAKSKCYIIVVPFTTLIGQLQSEVDLFEIPFEVLNAESSFVDIESKFSSACGVILATTDAIVSVKGFSY